MKSKKIDQTESSIEHTKHTRITENMSDSGTLRPTVNRVVRELVKRVGIFKPTLDVSFASKNGDSYSGEVYRIILRPDEQELEDHANNNVE